MILPAKLPSALYPALTFSQNKWDCVTARCWADSISSDRMLYFVLFMYKHWLPFRHNIQYVCLVWLVQGSCGDKETGCLLHLRPWNHLRFTTEFRTTYRCCCTFHHHLLHFCFLFIWSQNRELKGQFKFYEVVLHEVLIHSQSITRSRCQVACSSFGETDKSSAMDAKLCTAVDGGQEQNVL